MERGLPIEGDRDMGVVKVRRMYVLRTLSLCGKNETCVYEHTLTSKNIEQIINCHLKIYELIRIKWLDK